MICPICEGEVVVAENAKCYCKKCDKYFKRCDNCGLPVPPARGLNELLRQRNERLKRFCCKRCRMDSASARRFQRWYPAHREYRNKKGREYRKKWAKEGKCTRCGNEKIDDGMKVCDECLRQLGRGR